MSVDTAKVEGRRKLNYASYAELLADADRIGSGPAQALGNWSAGQIFRHLALVYNCSMDGFRISFPWYFRWPARMFKKKILGGAMPPGFKLPAEGGDSLTPGTTPTEEGLAELRTAVARLQSEPQRARHPVLGTLSHEEWDRLHLQHASLHMSFLVAR